MNQEFDPTRCHHEGCTAKPDRYLHLGVPAKGAANYKQNGVGVVVPAVFCGEHLVQQRPSQWVPDHKHTLEAGAAQCGVVALDYSRAELTGRKIGDTLWLELVEKTGAAKT